MNRKNVIQGGAVLALLLVGAGAPAFAATAPLPVEQHAVDGVAYVSGGIGAAESRRFEQAMGRHSLAIELLEHYGGAEAFTADARVRVADRNGRTVLDAQAEGPFMLVDLPPGRYSILASLKDATLRKSAVYVNRGSVARATFEFPAHTD